MSAWGSAAPGCGPMGCSVLPLHLSPCTSHQLGPMGIRERPSQLVSMIVEKVAGPGMRQGVSNRQLQLCKREEPLGSQISPPRCGRTWIDAARAATWEARHRGRASLHLSPDPGETGHSQRLCPVVLQRGLPPSHPGSHLPRSMRPLFPYF